MNFISQQSSKASLTNKANNTSLQKIAMINKDHTIESVSNSKQSQIYKKQLIKTNKNKDGKINTLTELTSTNKHTRTRNSSSLPKDIKSHKKLNYSESKVSVNSNKSLSNFDFKSNKLMFSRSSEKNNTLNQFNNKIKEKYTLKIKEKYVLIILLLLK